MKKAISILLVLVMALALCACGSNNAPAETQEVDRDAAVVFDNDSRTFRHNGFITCANSFVSSI